MHGNRGGGLETAGLFVSCTNRGSNISSMRRISLFTPAKDGPVNSHSRMRSKAFARETHLVSALVPSLITFVIKLATCFGNASKVFVPGSNILDSHIARHMSLGGYLDCSISFARLQNDSSV